MPTIVSTDEQNGTYKETYDDGTFRLYLNHNSQDNYQLDLEILQPLKFKPLAGEVEVKIIWKGDFGYSELPGLYWTIDDYVNFEGLWEDTFTIDGLTYGNTYTLKIRSAYDAEQEAVITFEFPAILSGHLRWDGTFVDYSEDGVRNKWRVSIYDNEWDTTADGLSDLAFTGDKVQIEWDQEGENLFEPLRGSRCILNLISTTDSEFEDVATGVDGRFTVVITKQVASAGLYYVVWCGEIVADHHVEPFKAAPYGITLTAVDGVGLLKNEPFVSRTGEKLNHNRISLYDLIFYTVQRIAWNYNNPLFDFHVYMPMKADGADVSSYSALASIYVDCAAFYQKNGEPFTFYEVLESVLRPLNLRLFQSGIKLYNYSWFVQFVDSYDGSVTEHLFNLYQSFSTTSRDYRVTMGCKGDPLYLVEGDHQKRYLPREQETRVNLEPLIRDLLHPEPAFGEFSFDSADNPIGWSTFGSLVLEKSTYYDENGDLQYAISFYRGTPVTSLYSTLQYIKHRPKEIAIGASETYQVEMKFTMAIKAGAATVPIYWVLLVGNYYMDEDGAWSEYYLDHPTESDTFFSILPGINGVSNTTVTQDGELTVHEVSIKSEDLPIDANQIFQEAEIRFYPQGSAENIDYYQLRKLEVRLLPQGENIAPNKFEKIVNSNARKGKTEETIRFGFYDSLENPASLIKSTFMDSDGAAIEQWELSGEVESADALAAKVLRMNTQRADVRRIFSGSSRGLIGMESQVNIEGNNYLVNGISYNLRKNIVNSTLVEVPGDFGWPETEGEGGGGGGD